MKFTLEFTNKICTYGGDHLLGEPCMEGEAEYYQEEYDLTDDLTREVMEDYWDYHNIDEYKKGIGEVATGELKDSEVVKALAKYGIKFIDAVMFTPKYYNFDSDSIDLNLEADIDKVASKLKKLKPHLDHYFKEVKQSSYDGFMSLEKDCFDELDLNDGRDYYAILYAILKAEGIDREDCEQELYEEIVDQAHEVFSGAFDWQGFEKQLKEKVKASNDKAKDELPF